jgi:hypothetical protein
MVLARPDHQEALTTGRSTPTALDQRVQRAAEQLGRKATELERLPFDLSALDADGVFCNVDARNFGLLDRRLDWHALGISLPNSRGVAFRPPRCGLVPDRYRLPLLRPADRAHAALHKFSYHFRLVETVFESAAYRWVPWRAWPEFEREFNATQAQLQAAMDAYTTDYDAIRSTVMGNLPPACRRLSASARGDRQPRAH